MAKLGGMMNKGRLGPIIMDCSIDYDGERFYAREDIDHKSDLPNRHKLYVDPETGEIKAIRRD